MKLKSSQRAKTISSDSFLSSVLSDDSFLREPQVIQIYYLSVSPDFHKSSTCYFIT